MTESHAGEELFDVVDELDHVIGQMPRSRVHRDRRLHRAVHVFVFNTRGELLVHLRAATKDEFPSVWNSSASGHVSVGEDYDVAVERELFEEVGLKGPLARIHKFAACEATAREHTVLYTLISDATPTYDPGEIAAAKFLPLAEVRNGIDTHPASYSPAFRHLFDWFWQHREFWPAASADQVVT